MTTQEIVAKLWNLCNVLRDDGITYHQYVTELTYILFLKMAKETGKEDSIPPAFRWDQLTRRSGIELKSFYKRLLTELGENSKGRMRQIYQGAVSNIDEPRIWKRSFPASMTWIGIPLRKKGWATCMKVCWKRTPMKRSPAQGSILRRVCLLMSWYGSCAPSPVKAVMTRPAAPLVL